MNQITKYIGLLAILPLAMVAIAPNYIGEADASNQHFVAIEKLKVLNAVAEEPTAELSLVQVFEPIETKSFSVKVVGHNPFTGFVPTSTADNAATYQVLYRVLNAVDSDVRNIEISVSSDTQTVSGELQGDLEIKRSIISVMIQAHDPASISAEIVDFDFKN